jgi:hypothetical protein
VNVVGIDSMILVYAGLVPQNEGTRSADFNELMIRSRLLIHQLATRKATVFLPTIAVSELLVPVPSAQKGLLIASLEERFVCSSFDLHAAALAADLWSQHNQLPADLRYESRHVLKADAMIVASAKAAGATDFYTHDRRCLALASLVMKAHDLPINDPDDMFIMDDLRRGEDVLNIESKPENPPPP